MKPSRNRPTASTRSSSATRGSSKKLANLAPHRPRRRPAISAERISTGGPADVERLVVELSSLNQRLFEAGLGEPRVMFSTSVAIANKPTSARRQ